MILTLTFWPHRALTLTRDGACSSPEAAVLLKRAYLKTAVVYGSIIHLDY